MFVTTVDRLGGKSSAMFDSERAAAEQRWAALLDKACVSAEQRGLTVTLEMVEVIGADTAAAAAAAQSAGQGTRIKSVRVLPPRSLKGKVREGGPGAVTEEVLAKAQATIDAHVEEYVAQARLDLVAMQDIADALMAPDLDAARRADLMTRLNALTYRMKGQGGTFGFPHISAVSNHLYVMSRAVKTTDAKVSEAVQVHIDAMHLILNRRLAGSTPEGQAIIEALNKVVVKIVGLPTKS